MLFALGGRRADFLFCLPESQVLTVPWQLVSSVSESEVFLQRLYFSATNYFIFIAKLNLPKPLIIQGILPPREDMEIWEVGIHYHTPSVQTDFSGTVMG